MELSWAPKWYGMQSYLHTTCLKGTGGAAATLATQNWHSAPQWTGLHLEFALLPSWPVIAAERATIETRVSNAHAALWRRTGQDLLGNYLYLFVCYTLWYVYHISIYKVFHVICRQIWCTVLKSPMTDVFVQAEFWIRWMQHQLCKFGALITSDQQMYPSCHHFA